MDRKRLMELSGQLDGWTEDKGPEEVLDEMHLGMTTVKATNQMDMVHHKKGHKSDDTEPKATHEKKVGGDVEKKDNAMKMVHHKKGHKSDDTEPKATHAVKSHSSSEAHAKGKDVKSKNEMDRLNRTSTSVTEMAKAIVESGDVENTLRELIAELQKQGIEL